MNNQISFSIILPLFNKERHIEQTITSILEQTFSNYELLVIDDGSTDNSCNIVKSFQDPRISIIHQTNGGPSKARNRGIKEAKGKFIAFIDADDSWHAEYLENQHLSFKNFPDIMWSCTGYQRIRGTKVIKTYCLDHPGIFDDAFDLIRGYIWTGVVAIKKEVFTNNRFLFNEEVSRSEDLELWLKLACIYPKIGYTNKILAYYNLFVDSSLTSTANDHEDFSYLTLLNRINNELSQIEIDRKEKIVLTMEAFCKITLLKTWKSTKLFKAHEEKFRQNLDKSLFNTLIILDFLPFFLKKVFIRILETLKLFGLSLPS